MAKQDEIQAQGAADFAARYGAGTDLLGVVALLIGPLAEIEQRCSKRLPGRLTGPRWESDDLPLQELLEDLAPQLGQLAGELGKTAAAVVKVTPKDGDRKRAGPASAETAGKPPASAEAGGKRS